MNKGIADAEAKKIMADHDLEQAKQKFEREGTLDINHLKKANESI